MKVVKTCSDSLEEMQLIMKIANRAVNELGDYPKLQAMMDLGGTHLNGCRLDLEGLLHAPVTHFMHDICGIRSSIDRTTGKLPATWTPRYCLERT